MYQHPHGAKSQQSDIRIAFYTHLLKGVLVPWNGAEGVKQLGLIHHQWQRAKINNICVKK